MLPDEAHGQNDILNMTADVVAAYVSHNPVPRSDLAGVIASVYASLKSLPSGQAPAPQPPQAPAVPVKKSVTPDFIICLDDGKRFKSLKRHITQLGMTPDEYRQKWGLPADYPMVAPNYAEKRSALAKASGLGRKAGAPKN